MFMLEEYQNTLHQLSKDQLIYIIDQMDMCCSLIGETCVKWSKMHIDSDKAIDNVRDYLIQYDIPFHTKDADNLKKYIDMKMERVKTCKDCANFIGGGDWNLCCTVKQGYWLCYEDTAACEKFVWKR